ncbi:MAG: efflux RND transporter periplasmic adaptor subunit, partial [Bryobacteraceae bacterium]
MTAKRAVTAGSVAAVAVALGIWGLRAAPQAEVRKDSKVPESDSPRRFTVRTGTIQRTIRVTGQTAARNFVTITAPMMRGPDSGRALVLIQLAEGGQRVKKGDLIAQIDAQSLKDHIDDVHSQVVQADADIKKRKAEQAIDWENLQQTLRAAKAELDKAKLDAGAMEIRMPIDIELLKLAVDEAEARLKQLQQDLKNRQDSFNAEIRILELTRDRHKRHRDRHAHDLEKFTMRAPIDGLAVRESAWRGGNQLAQIEVGDQVSPGQTFLKIVDSSSMQMTSTVSQITSDELRRGQPATVYLDGFPTAKLPARVNNFGQMATGGWRQQFYMRSLPLLLDIEGTDSHLIPDLSAGADIVVARKDNVLIIPQTSLINQGIRTLVRVDNGKGHEMREIEVG